MLEFAAVFAEMRTVERGFSWLGLQ